jgi:hypothetical protein
VLRSMALSEGALRDWDAFNGMNKWAIGLHMSWLGPSMFSQTTGAQGKTLRFYSQS